MEIVDFKLLRNLLKFERFDSSSSSIVMNIP